VNDKLLTLAAHFDTVFVHFTRKSWTASADKKVATGIEVNVRASGHATPDAAVDDLYAKVLAMQNARTNLPAL
jgi:hypothetical protein